MAAAVGTSFRNYQRWESGETRVSAEALLAAYKLRDAKRKRP
jgi:transcriptional regulator with XRE-family HTH domain